MLAFSPRYQRILLWLSISLFFLLTTGKPAWATGEPVAHPAPRHLTILTEPASAKIEILNIAPPYRPSMLLNPGRYHIAVSAPGYKPEKGFIDITDRDWTGKVILHPIATPARTTKETGCPSLAEGGEQRNETCKDRARLDNEWRELEKEKRELEQMRTQFAQEKRAFYQAKKDTEGGRQAHPPEAKTRKNAIPTTVTTPLPEEVSAQEKHYQEGATQEERAQEETTQEEEAMQGDEEPPKTALFAPPLTHLLDEITAYLERATLPNRATPPPEREAALAKLRQAQALAPDDPSVVRVSQLYAKRYLIYAGLFEQKVRADKMEAHLRTLGFPIFQQPMSVKGKPSTRICVGLFLERANATKSLRRLQQELGINDAILRIYRE